MSRTRSLLVASDGELRVERDPDRPTGRLLRQDEMDASYVDLADPRHLEFDYLRWMRLLLDAAGARRVLHVGGAACTLARALLAAEPDSRQEVVEIDPDVLQISREHLGLRKQPGLKLRVGDGRAIVAGHRDASFDAVVIDAFIGARVPRHLATVQALTQCARVAPLTLINVVDNRGRSVVRAVAAGLTEAYAHVGGVTSSGNRSGNVILYGSVAPPADDRLSGAAAADRSPARLLQAQELGGGQPWLDLPATGG